MTQPATDLPLTPRERLRWRRAMDALLIECDLWPGDPRRTAAGRTSPPP